MNQIGFARFANLAAVLLRRKEVCATHHGFVCGWVVLFNLLYYAIEANHKI
jgi:hypothetical protein